MASSKESSDDHHALSLALDHAWKWYEFWQSLAYQIINIYALVAAFMTAGYVSTFGAHLHAASAAIAAGAIPATWAAYGGIDRSLDLAARAEAPITAIQQQLSQQLNIASLQIVSSSVVGTSRWNTKGLRARLTLAFVYTVCVAAVTVALVN